MSIEAVDLIAKLRGMLSERVYEYRGQPPRRSAWRLKYSPEELAPLVDEFAAKLHAQRLADAGFKLVPNRRDAA
jgi:hypothetical protein